MTKHTPFIGILSGKHKKKPFSGDMQYFQNIQLELLKQGGISFVFTPFGIHHDAIEGFTFENGKWKQKTFPYPNVVYNRLPSEKSEKSEPIQTFFHNLEKRNIPFFNKQFINKWDTYTLLKANAEIGIHLPETNLLTDTEKALAFLKTYNFIYVKPINGKIGRGIFTLTYNNDNDICLATHTDAKCISKDQAARIFSLLLHRCQHTFMLQQGIDLHEINGHKYDFRILLLKPQSTWNVIGIGIRATNKQNITTHTLRGGTILPFHGALTDKEKLQLATIAQIIANKLNQTYPTLKECSLDIGKDKKGNFCFFEMNTKPMTFDEEDIEKKRIAALVKTFLELSRETKNKV